MRAANRNQHCGTDFACECTFVFPVTVLGADRDVRAFGGLQRSLEINVWRAYCDLIARVLKHQWQERVEIFFDLRRALAHLPVGSDQILARHWALSLLENI